jgi:hypothetical protein
MRQDGRLILQGMLRTAADGPGLEHDIAVMPDMPTPESLQSWEELRPDAPESYPFWRNLEGRISHPERIDDPGPYEPVFREWQRFRPRARAQKLTYTCCPRATCSALSGSAWGAGEGVCAWAITTPASPVTTPPRTMSRIDSQRYSEQENVCSIAL